MIGQKYSYRRIRRFRIDILPAELQVICASKFAFYRYFSVILVEKTRNINRALEIHSLQHLGEPFIGGIPSDALRILLAENRRVQFLSHISPEVLLNQRKIVISADMHLLKRCGTANVLEESSVQLGFSLIVKRQVMKLNDSIQQPIFRDRASRISRWDMKLRRPIPLFAVSHDIGVLKHGTDMRRTNQGIFDGLQIAYVFLNIIYRDRDAILIAILGNNLTNRSVFDIVFRYTYGKLIEFTDDMAIQIVLVNLIRTILRIVGIHNGAAVFKRADVLPSRESHKRDICDVDHVLGDVGCITQANCSNGLEEPLIPHLILALQKRRIHLRYDLPPTKRFE